MHHTAADILGMALLALGVLAWLAGRLPPLRHGRDEDWADAAAGLGGVVAGAYLATEFGGVGALPWMLVGVFAWWGLRAWGRPLEAPTTRVPPGPADTLATCLGLAAAAAVILGGFDARLESRMLALPVLGLMLGLTVVIPARWIRTPLSLVPSLGLAIAAGAAWWSLGAPAVAGAEDPASGSLVARFGSVFAAATDWRAGALGAAGATTAVVVHMGLLGAMSGSLASPSGSGGGLRRALAVALVTFVVGLGLASPSQGGDSDLAPRFDDPDMRAADGRAHMRPLERPHARAWLPSPRGQSIVLPTDTPLEPDHRYSVHFRTNPRGYKVGMLSETRNVIAVPVLDSTQNIEAVYFRSKDPARSQSATWDRKVAVIAERVALPSGAPLIELRPVDEGVNFRALSEKMEGPFIPLGDITLDLAVFQASAQTEAIGDHLAMVQVLDDGPRTDFDLQTLAQMGVRGPFLEARPPAPLAFVADARRTEGLDLGARQLAELRPPAKGLRLGEVRPNGELALPPWAPLAKLEYVAFHPRAGQAGDAAAPSAQSFYVPVVPAGEDGKDKLLDGQLRLRTATDAEIDLRAASKLSAYEGPFLVLDPQPLWLELHSGVNLADPPDTPLPQRGKLDHALRDARVWVPLGAGPEPVASDTLITPHAGAWIEAGMLGPFAASASGPARAASLGFVGLTCAALAWVLAAIAVWRASMALRVGFAALALLLGATCSPLWLALVAVAVALFGNLAGGLRPRRV